VRRPVLALAALAGCDPAEPPAAVDPAAVVAAFEALHAPIYDVYDLGADRDRLWDHLAAAFTGEALTTQYVEHWRTALRMAEEQTAIDVLGVEYEDVAVLPSDAGALRVDAAWRVRGVVTHQGHKHPRINRYRAVYTLVDGPGGLRIADTRMRDLARIATVERADAVFEQGSGSATEDGFMDPLELFEGGLFDAPEGDR
jgi:hypothetical protein